VKISNVSNLFKVPP